MKKKFLILLALLSFELLSAYSLDINDFTIRSKNTTILITKSKNEILSLFKKDKILQNELNNSCENYIVDGVDITFLGDKVISIILQNKKYYLSSNIKVGDKLTKVSKIYGNPDWKGELADGNYYIDYCVMIETNSPWKEPQYTMRFIYNNNKINKIVLFYSE